MADFASQILGIASQTAQNQPDLTGAVKSGADLALHVQQIQTQRAQIEQQKQEMLLNKISKVGSMYESAGKLEGRAQRFMYDKAIPNTIKALGLEEFYPESTQAMLSSSPHAVPYLMSQVRQDPSKMDGILQALQDPTGEALAAMYPEITKFGALSEIAADARDNTGKLEDAQKFGLSEVGKTERAQMVQTGQAARQQVEIGSAGQKKLAQDIATKYADYTAGGGKAGLQSAITNLEAAASALETGVVKTGGITTKIPGFKSDVVQSELNPKLVEIKTQAQAALNTVLRATLGAQFTEQEGIRVLNQVWDDKLAPSVNAKKVRNKIQELKTNVANAEREFVRFGYMTDPKGERVGEPKSAGQKTRDGVDKANTAPKKSWRDASPASREILINNWMKSTGKSKAEVEQMLDARARGE